VTAAPPSPLIVVVRSATDFALPLHQVVTVSSSGKTGRRRISSRSRRMIQKASAPKPESRPSAKAVSCSQRATAKR
jgi:hypothetical protein